MQAVTISRRLGYTLAPLGAHPTLKLTIPSSLGSLHLELRSVFLHGYFGFQGGTGLKPLCGSLDSGCPTFTSQNETDYNVVWAKIILGFFNGSLLAVSESGISSRYIFFCCMEWAGKWWQWWRNYQAAMRVSNPLSIMELQQSGSAVSIPCAPNDKLGLSSLIIAALWRPAPHNSSIPKPSLSS